VSPGGDGTRKRLQQLRAFRAIGGVALSPGSKPAASPVDIAIPPTLRVLVVAADTKASRKGTKRDEVQIASSMPNMEYVTKEHENAMKLGL